MSSNGSSAALAIDIPHDPTTMTVDNDPSAARCADPASRIASVTCIDKHLTSLHP